MARFCGEIPRCILSPVPGKTVHMALLILLAVLQTVQGAFSGITLCREESGKIVLEWSEGGQCESAGQEALPCINKSAQAAEEHCQTCLDTPVPSEKSVKSLTLSSEDLRTSISTALEFVLPKPTGTYAALPVPVRNPAFEHLSSIRLLI
jgi:hypothetical protein